MSHSHHHGPRHGCALEHGEAHTQDHLAWSRRDFLKRLGVAGAGVAFMYGGRPMNAFSQTPLLSALRGAETERVLVLVQLSGGNDGLNTVVPVENDIYYNRRPTIAIPKNEAIRLDDQSGLHPAMGSLEPLWGDGRMAVVHNVGYQQQSRSHFRGTDIWATGANHDEQLGTGWAGRYLEHGHPNYTSEPPSYPLAVRVGGATATLFQSSFGNMSMTFADATQFNRFVQQGGYYDADAVPSTAYGEALAHARRVTNASFRYVASVQEAADGVANAAEYPGSGLSRNLSVVARLIRGRLGARIFTVSRGGFDTHNDQGAGEGGHANNLRDVADSVSAFLADLAQDGLDREVLVMTFSEFGRTLGENGSKGTDHGAAAPVMLFGGALRGGLYGTQSDLTDLYGGDPRFTTDYRSIYQTVLRGWFDLPDDDVQDLLGGSYADLDFVNRTVLPTEAPHAPAGFQLEAPHPNPCRAQAQITFRLPTPQSVRLALYDVQGRRVRVVASGQHGSGAHTYTLSTGRLAGATYFCRLEMPDRTQTQQLIVLR